MKINSENRAGLFHGCARLALLIIPVWASAPLLEATAQLRKSKSEEPLNFIVPPDEDPSAFSPTHWGQANKGIMPALIPSLQQPPPTTAYRPRPDYKPTTSVGKYQASHSKQRMGRLSILRGTTLLNDPKSAADVLETSGPHGSVLEGTTLGKTRPYAAQPTPQVDPDVVPRLPFLQMTASEAAYQPSPYHVKPESPSFKEVMSTGAWFASYESMFLQPHFQGNTALSIDAPTTGLTRDFNFDYEHAPVAHFGFESRNGPGTLLKYWELDADSDLISATSNGTSSVTNSIWLMGPRRHSTLTATNAGETVSARHTMWINSLEAMLFKEIKMPISRLNGLLGFRYTQLHQRMRSELHDSGGSRLGVLDGTHYFRGWGPKIGFEYYRPIGHTHFEFLGGMNTTLMFGHRDQRVINTQAADFSLFAANELLSVTEAKMGAQWVREWGQRYRFFIRTTIDAQIWYGGGTAADPFRDFGLYGVTFGAGLNH